MYLLPAHLRDLAQRSTFRYVRCEQSSWWRRLYIVELKNSIAGYTDKTRFHSLIDGVLHSRAGPAHVTITLVCINQSI